MRKLRVKLHRSAVLTVRRTDVSKDELVYLIVASRPQKCRYGRSRVVYIGRTETGLGRVALSAAGKAQKVLQLHGVKQFEARIVTCQGRRRVKTWEKLEQALILCFRQEYGEVPALNEQGKKRRKKDELEMFKLERLSDMLRNFES
jgi:hypothetical protein